MSAHWVNRTTINPVGILPFSAAGGFEFMTPILSQPLSALILQRVLCDKVADAGEFNNSQDLMAIIHLLLELPHIYWNDVLEHAEIPSAAKENGVIYFAIEGGYLKAMGSSPGQFKRKWLIKERKY